MFSMTVKEAAALLGVGEARVHQLIKRGTLCAEKVGSIWLLDDESVAARRAAKPTAGRPAANARRVEASTQEYVLMNGPYEVLVFRFDPASLTFCDTDVVLDASRAPLGLTSPRSKKVSGHSLAAWWSHRAIPRTRKGVADKLVQLGLADSLCVPFKNLGLSLSDQYWIRPAAQDVRWDDVNYFDNGFAELSHEGDWLDQVGLDSPDNTSEGQLSKTWVCKDAQPVLVKGGSALNQEPFNEMAATALFRRVLVPGEFVEYRLGQRRGETVSLCDDFVGRLEEYIPAYHVLKIRRQPSHHNDYQHYIECCAALGIDDAEQSLAKMIVCDDIMANTDRHWRNFGIIRNIETLKCRPAPLFDTGTSLWCTSTLGALKAGDFSFTTKPFYPDAGRQFRLVSDYSWLSLPALDGFADEAIAILAGNPALADRLAYLKNAIQARIDRIARIL